MTASSRRVERVYLVLLLLHTLAASLIWGINTLFLLDAGLTNAQAFAANAFFTAGLVIFEVPTGVIADLRGRRLSYLLGTLTLTVSTVLYWLLWRLHAPFWAWALSSALLGLGFTFFSGAVQAWLVDALNASRFDRPIESVFAKGEIVEGIAMLTGSVAGGYIAERTDLGVPYLLRAGVLAVSFALAYALMQDVGFTPAQSDSPLREVRRVLRGALDYGLRNRPVRWIMLASMWCDGVSIYAFYAMQPLLLELYGDPHAYGVAGLAAAIVGGAQIGGGLLVPRLRTVFRRRTSVLLAAVASSTLILAVIAVWPSFWSAVILFSIWGLIFATIMPIRQAYLNDLIPGEHRATVLSFDSLMGSSGGVVAQPVLGKTADLWGYPLSYAASAVIQAVAIPFMALARRERAKGDSLV